MRVAIVGAGWAGLAAAVTARLHGHDVTVFEAARIPGGRARRLPLDLPDGGSLGLDNGQHILIGAYEAALGLMRDVGVDPEAVLARVPLALRFPDGGGLALPAWPAPWNALAGILRARGWRWRDRLALLARTLHWQASGYACDDGLTVDQVCAGLPARVREELIDPLCLSALNTQPAAASGRVFLRVLHDALLGTSDFAFAASDLLVPRVDLGAVFPQAACAWLAEFGATVRLGQRVAGLERVPGGWLLEGERWDRVVLACPPGEAARLAMLAGASTWAAQADALQHEAIATVYATGGPRLPLPLLALRGGPAQFVFDRSQLGGPAGLLAFVTSASTGSREEIEAATLVQARALGWQLTPLRTVVERRATFACTPGLQRPPPQVAAGLRACGDYVAGPYPATLEQAVRSGIAAGRDLGQQGEGPAALQPI